ncbi:nucleotide sugar dehydrogenase [Bdellovibrionota bacterium FG-2]
MGREKTLVDRIEKKEAVICILGLGYVGLPLMLRYNEMGYKVLGLDIDKTKVEALNQGRSYIDHIPSAAIQKAVKSGFRATTDFSEAKNTDAIIICVPTPLNKYREPDLSYVLDSMKGVLPYLQKGQAVSLESTTWPGTTDEELKPLIESRGFKVGEDVFLLFSPEREDPGNPKFETRAIPKVVSGTTPACLEVSKALYGCVLDKIVPVSTTRVAEMTKLLENIHRAVNIGLVNEMKIVCDKMGIDVHEVIRAAATKPFGFVPYYPGPGLGGHCIPIDPFYLTWKAREFGIHTRFIELAGEVNCGMPEWVVNKMVLALNHAKKSVKGSKVLVLGLSYKKNVDDLRESPSLQVMELLRKLGADVQYSDPFFPRFPKMHEHTFNLEGVPLTPETLKSFDLVSVLTDHEKFDYDLIQKHASLIVDTRGVYTKSFDNVVKA